MLIEHRTVSRKTALDGKLEITKSAADRLATLADPIPLDVGGQRDRVTLSTLDCACRGIDKPHVHYFLESALFKVLEAGSEVALEWDEERRTLAVAPGSSAA